MKDFVYILPEVFLVLTLAFVLIGEITYHEEQLRLILWTALLGLAGAFLQSIVSYEFGPAQLFSKSLTIDGLSLFFKLLFIMLAALGVASAQQSREIPASQRAEYFALLIASALGMSVAAASSDLLMAFLSLQFVNVVGFFLAGYSKRAIRSTEASAKYMITAAVAGGLFLFGLALLFAYTHSLNVYEIRHLLSQAGQVVIPRDSLLIIFMLVFIGLSFQLMAFPMYLWAPDVMEGSPTPASAFVAFGARAAGFAVAIRLFLVVFTHPSAAQGQWETLAGLDWPGVVAVVSGLSMVIGSLLSLRQQSAKRLVGCLLIAETGFLLLGLLVLDEVGISGILYNLVIELFAIVGIYFVLSFLVDELKSDRLEDLKNALARAVPECICLILFLVCLVGIPPAPGFIGKFTLIGSAFRHQWPVLAVVAILSRAMTTVSVSRLTFALVGDFKKSSLSVFRPSFQRKVFLAVLVVPIVLSGIFAEFVLDWAGKSLGFILW